MLTGQFNSASIHRRRDPASARPRQYHPARTQRVSATRVAPTSGLNDDVAHTHCHITDHVTAEPRDDVPGYAELRVTNRDALTRVVQNRGCDAHFAKLGDLARDLTSPHRDKLVEIEEYRNLKYAQDFDESHHLTVLSVLSPNAIRGFASCSYFYSQVIF